MISLETAAGVGVLGGILALDRAAFLQTMASRPLVASTLAGGLLGNLSMGMLCGTLLELLWLMDLPVGASLPPDETLAGVLASAFAVSAPVSWPVGTRVALGLLLALPFGYAGRALEGWVRRWNRDLLATARERVEDGRSVLPPHLLGGLRFFVVGSVAAGGGSLLGARLVEEFSGRLPEFALEALSWTALALPVIGIAAVVAALPSLRQRTLFGAAFIAGVLLERLLCGLGAWRGRCRL